MTLRELKAYYSREKTVIRGRLKEFELVYSDTDRRIFEELCFCIFTANASARMGLTCIELIRPALMTGSPAELSRRIKGHYRFWRVRPKYIVHTREYLKETCGLKMKELINSFGNNREALRDFFAAGKNIKGIGYKEASHFLRNIGFKGYAILDKHILNCLCEYGIINCVEPMNTKKKYIEVEEKMKKFAGRI
ncbi:MAG: DNA lyase, partial [Candidatus Firestonebacteria bacterium]